MKEFIIWGAKGHAKVLKELTDYFGMKLVALFDNDPTIQSPIAGVSLYCGVESFHKWKENNNSPLGFLVAIGGDRGQDRLTIHQFLEAKGIVPLVAIHPTAFVAKNAFLDEGTQILARAAICVEARLGKSCIVNTGATVDHECSLGNGVHVCPGAHLAGCVEVGSFATIGTGAVILPRVKIGAGAMIGAGAVVLSNVDPYTVVVGNPAKFLKKVNHV
jgi:sugar O-acyltransferase (sialic acid O-acetyltransferase NeuD family)